MRSASATFRRTMAMRRNFVNYADMTLADGTLLHLAPEDFRIGGNTINDDIVDGDAFCIGTAIGKTVTISLDNTDELFSLYDFYGATFFLYVGLELENEQHTVEKLRIGKFTVITPATTGTVITMEAVDNMYLFDRPYSDCPTSYPATLSEIVTDICTICGVTNNTGVPSRDRYNTEVKDRPTDDLTCRQVLSYVAQILCVNAKIDQYGALIFTWYTDTVPEPYADGGNYRKVYKQDGSYFTGAELEGGDFTRVYKQDGSYATGDDFDGGWFSSPVSYHDLGFAKNVQVGTDNITITAVKIKNGEEEYTAGDPEFKRTISYNEGDVVRYQDKRYMFNTSHRGAWNENDVDEIYDYRILIEDNPLTVGSEMEIAQALWANIFLNFIPFRPFSLSYLQDPTIESGDWVIVCDAKMNTYFTFCTSVQFTTGGYTNISCKAQSPVQQFSTYSSQSAKAIVAEARKTAGAISTYDIAVQRMSELAANAGGNYFQTVTLEDGSVISYIADKPMSVALDGTIRFTQGSHAWKMTGSGFFNSTSTGTNDSGDPQDPGHTEWTNGIDANNNAVMNTISAIGINAEWINTGTLKVGGTTSNTDPKIEVRDSSGTVIGKWTKDGIEIYDGVIEGPSISGVEITGSEIRGTEIYGTEIHGGSIDGTEITGGTIVGTTIKSDDSSTFYELEYNRITGYQDNMEVGFFDWWGSCDGHQSLGIGGNCLNIWTDYLYVGDDGGSVYQGETQDLTIDGIPLHFHKGLFVGTW